MAMTMRERIARAVRRAMIGPCLGENRDLDAEFSGLLPSDKQPYFAAADAVLSELETPTEWMVGKALSAFYANGVETCSTREAICAAILRAKIAMLEKEAT